MSKEFKVTLGLDATLTARVAMDPGSEKTTFNLPIDVDTAIMA